MSIKKEIINEEKVTKICYVNRESSVIAVSNRFLELMHNFTATQIDMVYEVVAAVQKYRVAEADLPDKLIVGIEFKVLTQKHSLQNIIDSIGKLGKGAVMFWDRRRQDDKVFKHTTYMFHGIDIRHDLKMAVFDIHCDCISKIFTEIETEFTILNVDKLLDIPHVYAKRMYLLCNRWKNKEGHLMYKLDAFRYMMGLNPIIRKGNKPKFKQISELKRKVLDNSEKTLKEISDVWFKYELVKHESASINVIGIDLYRKEKDTEGEPFTTMPVIQNASEEVEKESWDYCISSVIKYYRQQEKEKEKVEELSDVRRRFMERQMAKKDYDAEKEVKEDNRNRALMALNF